MISKFLSYPSERIALLVDGTSTYVAAKTLKIAVDYSGLVERVGTWGILFRSAYFTSISDTGVENPMVRMIDYLEFNGWMIVDKPMREVTDRDTGERKMKTVSMAVDIAMAGFELAVAKADHIVLCSGDGALVPMVQALQRRGVRVTVISTIKEKPQLCSDELRRAADNFIELDDMRTWVTRKDLAHG